MNLEDWQVLGVMATAAAAVATTASAIVIAVQSVHTRRSAVASEDAVKVAQDTLRESQLARLDARAPLLHVKVYPHSTSDVTDRRKSDGKWVSGTVAEETVFRTPRDLDRTLKVAFDATIRNDGPSPIELSFSPPFKPDGKQSVRRMVLAGSQVVEGSYLINQKLREWIRISRVENLEEDGSDLAATFTCSYKGPNDADVDETVVIESRGTIVGPIEGEGDGWTILDVLERSVESTVQPAQRTYFKSRVRNERFS